MSLMNNKYLYVTTFWKFAFEEYQSLRAVNFFSQGFSEAFVPSGVHCRKQRLLVTSEFGTDEMFYVVWSL